MPELFAIFLIQAKQAEYVQLLHLEASVQLIAKQALIALKLLVEKSVIAAAMGCV